jgi:hypothetical protein
MADGFGRHPLEKRIMRLVRMMLLMQTAATPTSVLASRRRQPVSALTSFLPTADTSLYKDEDFFIRDARSSKKDGWWKRTSKKSRSSDSSTSAHSIGSELVIPQNSSDGPAIKWVGTIFRSRPLVLGVVVAALMPVLFNKLRMGFFLARRSKIAEESLTDDEIVDVEQSNDVKMPPTVIGLLEHESEIAIWKQRYESLLNETNFAQQQLQASHQTSALQLQHELDYWKAQAVHHEAALEQALKSERERSATQLEQFKDAMVDIVLQERAELQRDFDRQAQLLRERLLASYS